MTYKQQLQQCFYSTTSKKLVFICRKIQKIVNPKFDNTSHVYEQEWDNLAQGFQTIKYFDPKLRSSRTQSSIK